MKNCDEKLMVPTYEEMWFSDSNIHYIPSIKQKKYGDALVTQFLL